jgi:HD-GYP domain-containing protein (c-di-GMP phosphodiesterase class II)
VSEALAIMREGRGKHFDPEVLDAFLDVIESPADGALTVDASALVAVDSPT